MMPSRSTPNLQQHHPGNVTHRDKNHHHHQQQNQTIYSYLQNPSGGGNKKNTVRDEDSPPPAPPVRDSSTLKSIKYGPGHEKYPSWPVPAAAETPPALRNPPGGGSHRSKSWTDHTNYPKEKVVAYTRPYMKRQHSLYTQQKLKTVMERCEKIPPETYESKYDKLKDRFYIPGHVDRDGQPGSINDMEYMVPSPPERDIPNGKPPLTQADLEEYARSYQDPVKYSSHHLTKSGLEEFMEYTSNYEDSLFSSMGSKHELSNMHQKQLSYAQSEGYHSYVSSTDSTSTPFLDRLRRDSEAARGQWEEQEPQEVQNRREGRDSVVTTSSGSVSSSETLKWHGSMSDVSVASSSCTHLANSSSSSSVSRQLIVHSARVQTPQRHHSESVLYMGGENNADGWKDKENRNNNTNKLKLFAVNTYTVPEKHNTNNTNNSNRLSLSLSTSLSVADRISELEKQQKYSYLDPEKKHKVPDPTLKAIQKKALLSFYERHQNPSRNSWRSEPQLAQAQQLSTPSIPQPPPRVKMQLPSRRASSASDYASGNSSKRSSLSCAREAKTTDSVGKPVPKHQYSNSCGSLATDFLGPMIVGQAISLDDFVPDKPPARPPKNPHLRSAFPDLFVDQRIPSPDLPLPSPPTVLEDEVVQSDEPLPPPPPEIETRWQNARSKDETRSPIKQTVGLPEQVRGGVRSSIRTRPGGHIFQQVSSKHYGGKPEHILGFPNQQTYAERSNTKYPTAQKLVLGVAVSQKVVNGISDQYRAEPLRSKEEMEKDMPPPLQPRQSQTNQSMRGRVARNSPPKEKCQPLSQSKASYLASRRDRDRIVPDSDTGSYKRTMSPNGHSLTSEVIPEPQKPVQKESIWSLNRNGKEVVKNNSNLIRRSSMNNEKKKATTLHEKKSEDKEELKKATMVLPDVLPMTAKMLTTRSQQYRPTNLNLVENGTKKSPPLSPTKTTPPPRGSPFTPLRSTNLSNPPMLATSVNSSYIRPTPKSMSPVRTYTSSSTNVSPPSPKRISPQIKQPLSPSQAAAKKASPASSNTSSPLQTSPLTSPNFSPKSSPPPSPKECPPLIEGLQLIQRTEVVLRVNTTTTDAASQTEKEELPPTPLPTRKKLQEEIECEKLSEDFVNHLPTSDRLKEILVPGPEYKKPTDYVHGLFKVEATRPRPANSPFRSRNNTPSSSPPPTSSPKLSPVATSFSDATSPLSGSSTYFTISESRARFLNRFSQDMNQCHTVKDTKDLNLKKGELVSRLDKKLEVLRSEQLVVSEECKINNELGDNVEAHIRRLARPHEADKFRLHVEEVGKITSLLLGLSGRLARAENALMGMEEDHPERRILESKRDKLLEQLEEAKKLKECIDRRSVNVSHILYKYLNSEEYTDYDHFINMKAKLIMDSKEIAEKIKLGEEQLSALKSTLIVTD